MRLVVRRAAAVPVTALRRALSDPADLVAALLPWLDPVPPDAGMAAQWRISARVGDTPRDGRVWLPVPQPCDACHAVGRMEGLGVSVVVDAEPDTAGAAVLRVDVRLVATGMRARVLLGLLRVAEPTLRARIEGLADRLAQDVAARKGAV